MFMDGGTWSFSILQAILIFFCFETNQLETLNKKQPELNQLTSYSSYNLPATVAISTSRIDGCRAEMRSLLLCLKQEDPLFKNIGNSF